MALRLSGSESLSPGLRVLGSPRGRRREPKTRAHLAPVLSPPSFQTFGLKIKGVGGKVAEGGDGEEFRCSQRVLRGVGVGQCRWPSRASTSQLMQREGLDLPVSCITEEVQFHENFAILFFWSTESQVFF